MMWLFFTLRVIGVLGAFGVVHFSLNGTMMPPVIRVLIMLASAMFVVSWVRLFDSLGKRDA